MHYKLIHGILVFIKDITSYFLHETYELTVTIVSHNKKLVLEELYVVGELNATNFRNKRNDHYKSMAWTNISDFLSAT